MNTVLENLKKVDDKGFEVWVRKFASTFGRKLLNRRVEDANGVRAADGACCRNTSSILGRIRGIIANLTVGV